jgi:hypothetical protein
VVDHPAGRLARVVPALEAGDGDRRGKFADVAELDDFPPPTTENRTVTDYVVRLTRWVTEGVSRPLAFVQVIGSGSSLE